MSENGKIVWTDLTVPNAEEIRDFYQSVVGWSNDPLSMGDYDDYCMKSESGDVVTGICHARDSNRTMPSQWIIYVQVPNVNESAKKATELGGKVIEGPRQMGEHNFCVIQDPAGAMLGLIEGN